MPRLLDLCSGTGSVGQAFAALGWDVVSVDNDPRARLAHGPIDFLWASPPCGQYSCARKNARWGPRDLEGADRVVAACLRIARELGVPFILENPYTGLLKQRPVMLQARLPMRVVDYCKYGAPYRKRTALWTNTTWTPSRPLCQYDCTASEGRRHPICAQWGDRVNGQRIRERILYALPAELTAEVAEFADGLVRSRPPLMAS